MLQSHIWHLPMTDPEGMGGYTPPTWNKIKATLKSFAKFYDLERKANFINTNFYFVLHYCSKDVRFILRCNVISLYVICKLHLLNKQVVKLLYINIFICVCILFPKKYIVLKWIPHHCTLNKFPTPKTCTSIPLVNCFL